MSSVHGYTSTQEQWSPDAETSADVRRTLVHLCIQTLLPHDGTRGQWPRRAPTSVHQWSPMLMSRRHLVTLYYRVYVSLRIYVILKFFLFSIGLECF